MGIIDDDHSHVLLFLRGGHTGRTIGRPRIVAPPEDEHRILRVLDVAPLIDQQNAFAVPRDDERDTAIGALFRCSCGVPAFLIRFLAQRWRWH